MKFTLIVCTLGERPIEFNRLIVSLQEQIYKDFEVIVITQGKHGEIADTLEKSNLNYLQITTDKKGLSRARNLGLNKAKGEYITISDDDCWYPPASLDKVFGDFIGRFKEVDVLCYKIYDPISDVPYKTYSNSEKPLGIRNIGACSSIEIFYKNTLVNKNLRFDEKFGLGAIYPSGEENIFLSDLLRKGNRIVFIPQFVVYHRKKDLVKTTFNTVKMETALHMFKRIFGKYKGIGIYCLYYIKHFRQIDNKVKALFLNLK